MAISTGGCPGYVFLGGRVFPGGVRVGMCPGGGCPGEGYPGGDLLDPAVDTPWTQRPTPHPCEQNDRQTGVKTLPCP